MKTLLPLLALMISFTAGAQKVHYNSKIQIGPVIRKGYDTAWYLSFQNKADPKEYSLTELPRYSIEELTMALDSLLKLERAKDMTITLKSGMLLSNYCKDHIVLLDRQRKYTIMSEKKTRKFNAYLKKKILRK